MASAEDSAETPQLRGGIVIETRGAFRFLPASVATSVVPGAPIVPVPGLVAPAVGVVLTDEQVATVLRIGNHDAGPMVLCDIEGGSVALAGARIVATGVFPALGEDGVVWCDEPATILDVRALMLDVETAIWRAGGRERDEM